MTQPEPYTYTDPSGDRMTIGRYLTPDGPAVAFEQDDTIHVPLADTEEVITAIRAAAGQPAPDAASITANVTQPEPTTEQRAPLCDLMFETGTQCAKPAGHCPPGSDDLHMPAETLRRHERWARWQKAARKAGLKVDRNALRAVMAIADEEGAELQEMVQNGLRLVGQRNQEIRSLRAELEQARAATLRERADYFEGVLRNATDPEGDPRYWSAISDIITGLRHLADGEQQAEEQEPVQLRWGLNDVMWGDDDSTVVMLSGPDREPYWLELDSERAAVLQQCLAGPSFTVETTDDAQQAGRPLPDTDGNA